MCHLLLLFRDPDGRMWFATAAKWFCLFLLPPIPPSIRVFSNESVLHMRWPKYWSFSFNIIPVCRKALPARSLHSSSKLRHWLLSLSEVSGIRDMQSRPVPALAREQQCRKRNAFKSQYPLFALQPICAKWIKKKLFIWLCQVLVVACGLF